MWRVLLGITQFYLVLPGFLPGLTLLTGFYWVLADVGRRKKRWKSSRIGSDSRPIEEYRWRPKPEFGNEATWSIFFSFFYGFGPVLFFVLGWNCSPYHIFMTSNSRHTRSINEIVLEDRVHIWSEWPRNKIIGWKWKIRHAHDCSIVDRPIFGCVQSLLA